MEQERWHADRFRPFAMAAMVGSLAWSFAGLVHLFFPQWNSTYVIVGCVLAALEANYSFGVLRARRLEGMDTLRFRITEIALMFVLLKVGSYAGRRWSEVLADVGTWPRQPSNLFSPETLVVFLLALVSWWACTDTLRDLRHLSESPHLHRSSPPPIRRITGRFFLGGALLLVITGLTRIGIAGLLDLRRPTVSGLVVNALVYFVLGLAMMGQAYLTRLKQIWETRRISVQRRLPSRWVRYTLVLLGLASVVAFLLPTGYTVGLLDAGYAVVRLLGNIVFSLGIGVAFIFALVHWLFVSLWGLLFGDGRSAAREVERPPTMFPRPTARGPGAPIPNWLDVLRSLAFWVTAAGIVCFVVYSYLRDNPELLAALTGLRPIRSIRVFLAALFQRVSGLAKGARASLHSRLGRRSRARPSLTVMPILRPLALSPRERIQYYYLSILRRAGRVGFPRRRAQTPNEYSARLGPNLPEAREDLARLTGAFVEARYSVHPIDRETEQPVRASWRQVRSALRALRRRDR